MWVKICGTTSLEDAQVAVDAGANALGFVFAESPRRLTVEQAKAITSRLGETVEKIGVFVVEDYEEIVATVWKAGLTGVQLHGALQGPGRAGGSLTMRLRERFADGTSQSKRLGILRVLHYDADLGDADLGDADSGGADMAAQLAELREDPAVDAVLVDSRSAHARGGTGTRFDWKAASRSFREAAPHLRMIVAGGLNPENVREAIETLDPWGVDVVSGVETAPGRKDPARVKEFIREARAAAGAGKMARAAEVQEKR